MMEWNMHHHGSIHTLVNSRDCSEQEEELQ